MAAEKVASIPFCTEKHIAYIRKISADVESFEYLVTQHLRMSGVYWGLSATALLGKDLKEEASYTGMIDWILQCQDKETGGFGGNVGHDAHLLYTQNVLLVLAMYDEISAVDADLVANYVAGLQQPDGSFAGDKWGEIDSRFSYCALSIMSLLGQLHNGKINLPKAIEFVASCRNFDGGFGAVPGAESHAGQIFCCVAALSIGEALHHVDADLLGWWLSERQCDSGGLNGRPEKQADVCYSWWILSSLSILGRTAWIDCPKLAEFIFKCQDQDEGGISDRPGNMGDIFHTYFGICGLLLLNAFDGKGEEFGAFDNIDPTYALPVKVVRKLGLRAQVLPELKI